MRSAFRHILVIVMTFGISFSAHSGEAEVMIQDPYVRATPPGQKVTGGFLRLENRSDRDVSLVAAHSDVAAKVELHHSQMEDGMMRMRRVMEIKVPAGESVSLQPGGLHMMMMGLKRSLKPGDRVELELVFADGMVRHVTVPVRKVMARMKREM